MALEFAQCLDQSSLFVVEELDRGAVFCRERCLENHAEIVGCGVGRTRLEMLDERFDGFRRDREAAVVDRHVEVLGDEPRILEVARPSVGWVQRIASSGSLSPSSALKPFPSAPRTMWLSPKLAGRMIPDLPNVKPRWQGGLPTLYRDGVIQVIVRRLTARYRNRISEGTGFGPATVEHEAGAGGVGYRGAPDTPSRESGPRVTVRWRTVASYRSRIGEGAGRLTSSSGGARLALWRR